MAGFNPDDYVDVAERVRVFHEKYPLGSLQSEMTFLDGGVLCKAYAYRTPDDERPSIGHAFEAIPGKTTFTKDSEVMNAETSAWGRAIVALGFPTKKIASTEEVRNRQGSAGEPPPGAAETPGQASPRPQASGEAAGATDPQREKIEDLRVNLGLDGKLKDDEGAKLAVSAKDPGLTREKARDIIAALEKRMNG